MMKLLDQYRSWPRSVRWMLWFAAAMIFYFAVAEPVVDLTVATNARAAIYRTKLDSYDAKLNAARAESADLALGMRRFGRVDMPGEAQRRPGEFNTRISEILRANDVQGESTRGSNGTLRVGALSDLYGGQRVGTRVREIEFTGSPEQIAAVLADLELSPVIAAISAIDITQADDRRTRSLSARITAEAWIAPEKAVSP